MSVRKTVIGILIEAQARRGVFAVAICQTCCKLRAVFEERMPGWNCVTFLPCGHWTETRTDA